MPKILVKITRTENCQFFKCNIDDVVQVDFEEYIAAVVASEIGNAHREACKAQAIAARGLAISRGVFNNNPISDSSSVAQAYRAKRYNRQDFPEAIIGTELTKGQVLFYNNKIAVTHYSANNGGRTTSSQQRWGGGAYPYLIQQEDPWDAATKSTKYGHGVGMSQLGAIWAANNGIGYQKILQFYYPGCVLKYNYGGLLNKEQLSTVILNQKAKAVIELCKSKLGDPYVFGAYGDKCTPTTRQKYASYHPEYHDNIYNSCAVLSSRQSSCQGCKWQGHLCYDCRGFAGYVIKVGAKISIEGAGATSQYSTKKNWQQQGLISEMPNVVCNVFKYRNGKMSHTGIHIGDGNIIHCSTTVKNGSLTDTTWTHYAIPKGLYTKQQLEKAGKVIMVLTIKKGSSGDNVKELQQMLNTIGANLKIDGVFGQITENIVKDFQSIIGLDADGIVGPLTWAALRAKIKAMNKAEKEEEQVIKEQKEVQIKQQGQNIILPKELGKQLFDFLKQYYE